MEQLYLFQDNSIDRLEREVRNLREQSEKVRKGQYAKIGHLTKLYEDTRHEIDILKEAICKVYE